MMPVSLFVVSQGFANFNAGNISEIPDRTGEGQNRAQNGSFNRQL
jgi:hypothetical protein